MKKIVLSAVCAIAASFAPGNKADAVPKFKCMKGVKIKQAWQAKSGELRSRRGARHKKTQRRDKMKRCTSLAVNGR
jgi:hypothetical protein